MKKFLLSILMICSCALAQAAERPEVSRYVRAYSGEEGIKVFVVRIGAVEKGEVLLQLTGIDSPQDGIIQKARVESRQQGQQRRYYVKRNGQDVAALILDRTAGAVYLPSQPNSVAEPHVAYDESLSQQCNAEHMVTQWIEQGSK